MTGVQAGRLGIDAQHVGFARFAGVAARWRHAYAEPQPLLTPAEVAAVFGVSPKTATRWAQARQLSSIRTLGVHRRYPQDEVEALRDRLAQQAS